MEDGAILDLYFARCEQAIVETEHKYGRYCLQLSRNILGDPGDAEECVNDAYLGLWNAIPPHRPDPLLPFLCRIVRNLSCKRHRARNAGKRCSSYDLALEEIAEILPSSDSTEEALDARELARYLEVFLASLRQEDRVLFLRRYWFADSYQEIARRMGLSEKNVSVRLSRLRKRLQTELRERGLL